MATWKKPAGSGAIDRLHRTSLQGKVILLVLSLFALLLTLSVGIQQHFVMPSFKQLERESAVQDMERAVQAIDREDDFLVSAASDWATWTDTYDYMADRNKDYASTNLLLSALLTLRVDAIFLFDECGGLVWGKAHDRNLDQPRHPVDLEQGLPAGHALRSRQDSLWACKGLLMTSCGPLLLGARPIVTSESRGPVRGSLMMGRFLDDSLVQRLSRQARVPFTISRLDRSVGVREREVLTELSRGGEIALRSDRDLHVYRILRDVSGRPALLLRVDVPMDISARGKDAVLMATVLLAGAGILTVIVLILALRRMVLLPTRRLTEHAKELGHSGAPTAIFSTDRQDELGVLAHELNHMVEQLAEARRRLLEQSWSSGAAEMAGGILHNIGNTLTPMNVQGEILRRELGQAPLADLFMVLEELERPGTEEARRRDLLAFARLALEESRQVMRRAGEAGRALAGQADHIARILADQERFSRAERVLERTRLADLLRESAALVPASPEARLDIQFDASIEAVGAAEVARVALQQIFSNLMINAAESVARTGRDGLLRVTASAGPERAQGLLHLVFADDGAGIEAGNLGRVFERGWSTKQSKRACGLGLHWCSNTLHAMGGGILAESAGAGLGAVFHVTLPWPAAAATVTGATREPARLKVEAA